ncbi:hypothetical protein P692DRAFT_20217448 [Suillus brevipes Sb2]|nr:hypothetical protein P692DRAFT_20217448 [Suillus brevipes Sb2]
MTSFVPGHFDDYPPPLGEGLNHAERLQDPEQTTVVTSVDETLQVAVNGMCHRLHLAPTDASLKGILVILYFVLAFLFRFATDTMTDPLDDTPQALGVEPATRNSHKTRERLSSRECNKSSLLVMPTATFTEQLCLQWKHSLCI